MVTKEEMFKALNQEIRKDKIRFCLAGFIGGAAIIECILFSNSIGATRGVMEFIDRLFTTDKDVEYLNDLLRR